MAEPGSETARRVRRRKVFYVAGFDPHGAGKYYAIYHDEAARQAAVSGYDIDVGKLTRGRDGASWTIQAKIEDAEVETDYELMRWEDLVLRQMRRPWWRRALRGLRAYPQYILNGAIFRMGALALRPNIPILYPFLFLLLYLAAGVFAGWLVWRGVMAAAEAFIPAWAGWATIPALAAGGAAAWALLRLTPRLDRGMFVYYLLDTFIYTFAEHAAGRAPELDERLDRFGERIRATLTESDYDEVLVVGHSCGTYAAGLAAARALAGLEGEPKPAFSLLTLGNTTQGALMLPEADRSRAEFAAMAADDRLRWVDVTSFADGACFALVDPLTGPKGAPPESARLAGPKVISARFRDTMGPELHKQLRFRYYRMHFQYLYAFMRPDAYDYFKITAGPLTLHDRFRAVRPSKRAPWPVYEREKSPA